MINVSDKSPLNTIVISTTHGIGHGAEAVLENLLCAWKDRLPHITLVAPIDSGVYAVAQSHGFTVYDFPSRRDAFAENITSLANVLPRLSPATLVHAWHARGFELACLAAWMLECPATGTLHDHPAASFHGLLRRLLMRVSAKRLRGMVTVSDALTNICVEQNFGHDSKTIHNGLLDRISHAAPPSVPVRKTIGFLGMYAEWKGFAIVKQWIHGTSDLDWKWHLYGDITPRLAVRAKQLAHDASSRVVLRGHVPSADIFQEIDILVHASTEFEPFGMVMLEAARASIPVVASSLGGVPEIVEPDVTGFLFDHNSPDKGLAFLRTLIADSDLRIRFGKAARQRYETLFRAEHMADKYAHFWRSILSNRHQKKQ